MTRTYSLVLILAVGILAGCSPAASSVSTTDAISREIATFKVGADGTLTETRAVQAGDRVRYRITATNQSNRTLPGNLVVLSASALPSTTYVNGSATQGNHLRTIETGQAVHWTVLDPMPPGSEVTVEYDLLFTRPPEPAPFPSAAQGQVVYHARLPAGCGGLATYSISGGTQQTEIESGWTFRFRPRPGDFLYLSVQNTCSRGAVMVYIINNSGVYRTATSTGAYVIATVTGEY